MSMKKGGSEPEIWSATACYLLRPQPLLADNGIELLAFERRFDCLIVYGIDVIVTVKIEAAAMRGHR